MSDSTTVAAMSIRRGIVPGLLAVGLIVGCSPEVKAPDDPTSGPSVTVSPSPSPTPTPTPTPSAAGVLADGVKPTRPAALDQPATGAGAIEVLTYYLLLVPYAQNAGDLQDLSALSHPDCQFCSSVVDGVTEMANRKEHAEGGAYHLADAAVMEVDVGRWFSVDVTLHEEPSRDVDRYGGVIREYPEGTNTVNAVVVFEAGEWKIRGLAHEKIAP